MKRGYKHASRTVHSFNNHANRLRGEKVSNQIKTMTNKGGWLQNLPLSSQTVSTMRS